MMMVGARTAWHRWIIGVVFILVVFYLRPSFIGLSSSRHLTSTPLSEFDQLKKVLKENGIGPGIDYASRHLRSRATTQDRLSITEVENDLFPNPPTWIHLDQSTTLPPSLPPVYVPVQDSPRPDRVDASTLIFGVSTTFPRFDDEVAGPLKEWIRWLTDGHGNSNGATLVLMLHQASELQLETAKKKLAAVGIDATVQPSNPDLDMPGRYLALVTALYNHPTRPSREYFALIDDDTFFPSISNLLNTLSHYDPNKPYYIGAFTERVDWIMEHGLPMAYGGGGIFLTAPVAKALVSLTPICLEKDAETQLYKEWGAQGDLLLYNCLYNHTEISLTYVPQLHQMDQWGDPSGFYESGQQPLSLHHYKSWHHLAPEKTHLVSEACGLGCVLQRFQFRDNWIISNGYSVAQYPQGIDFDTQIMEGTFDNGDVSLSYSFGPLRKSLSKTGRKRQWLLLEAWTDGLGRVTQVYVKRRSDNRWVKEGDIMPSSDGVLVLVWES